MNISLEHNIALQSIHDEVELTDFESKELAFKSQTFLNTKELCILLWILEYNNNR